jgi:predicted MFS family arabinose efflux permease
MASRLSVLGILRFLGDTVAETEYFLVVSYVLRAFAWGSLPFIGTIAPLFIVQVLLGAGDGVGSPAFGAIFAKHLDSGKQVAEYSDYNLTKFSFGIVGTLGGGIIVSSYGFDALFYVMSAIAFFCAAYILLQPRSSL